MARGQAQAADTQIGINRKAAGTAGENAGKDYGALNEQAQGLINSTGYDPATLGAITNAGMGGVNAAFGDAENQLNRSVATSRNPAGTGAQLDALARSKGIAGGEEAGKIQIANAGERERKRSMGLDLLNSMYGTETGKQVSLSGQVPGLLSGRAAGGGWAQGFHDVLTGIGSLGKGGGGGGGGNG